MIQKTDAVLVIGAGSIGERYIRNLWSLGYQNIVVLRKRNHPFRDIGNAQVNVITSWNEVDVLKPAAAFVCTPTAFHLENAIDCVNRFIPVLVEKPLSDSTDRIHTLTERAIKNHVLVQVGYMMRYHPLLKRIKEMTESKSFGNLLHIHSYWGEYLPDWHPWEDYRYSYAAKKELGGGVALTLSHDLDLSNWIAGSAVQQWQSLFNYKSSLEVDVEAGADFLLNYKNGITAHVHLNYYQRVKERYYQYIFDEAVVRVDFFKNELTTSFATDNNVERLDSFDRNSLFVSQIIDFFSNLNKSHMSVAAIEESEQIIKMCKNK